MYRIAVCDNNVADGQELFNKVQQLVQEMKLEVEVDSFRSARALYDAAKDRAYKLVLLETEIGGASGIDLAKRLRLQNREMSFIFVTSHAEHALAAYSVFPTGYILKRVTRATLYEPFARVFEKESLANTLLFRSADGGEVVIPMDELMYIEVYGNGLDFHCKEQTLHGVGSLASAEAMLPRRNFFRSHRNFIVNLQYVQRLERYYFGMRNGDTVAVAKNRYTEVRAVFEEFLRS